MQNLKPKKYLGQHFLADENIARKIVSLVPAAPQLPVVEIGPGMGVLTKYLLAEQPEVHVVEFDPDAVAYLQAEFPGPALRIHAGDVLAWDPSKHLAGEAHFIGNLPYNVSSPIFFHLLAHRAYVRSGAFMVQKEVADRICAEHGGPVKERGILTVLLDCYFQLHMAFKVPPTVFRPPPKVMSAVFTMQRREGVDVPFAPLLKVVKAAFGQRRKTLRNALKPLNLDKTAFPDAWLDLRAEVLTTAQFVVLAQALR
jgi:16S rRNA (adenine1518-N6/adenine1519-N6)-dimethyltransferase